MDTVSLLIHPLSPKAQQSSPMVKYLNHRSQACKLLIRQQSTSPLLNALRAINEWISEVLTVISPLLLSSNFTLNHTIMKDIFPPLLPTRILNDPITNLSAITGLEGIVDKKPVTRFAALTNLTALHLDSGGTMLPAGMGKGLRYATKLEYLRVNCNLRPAEVVTLNQVTTLRYLDLRHGAQRAEGLLFNTHITSLSMVDGGCNRGALHRALRQGNIKRCDIDGYGEFDTDLALAASLHLTELYSNVRCSSEAVPYLSRALNLQVLHLSYPDFKQVEELFSIYALPALRELRLKHLTLVAPAPQSTSLTKLNLSFGLLASDVGFEQPPLRSLNLSSNRLQWLDEVVRSTTITKLNVFNNLIHDIGAGISVNSVLTDLNVRSNRLSSKGILALQGNLSLLSLDLRENKIDADGLIVFRQHSSLTHLALGVNPIPIIRSTLDNHLVVSTACDFHAFDRHTPRSDRVRDLEAPEGSCLCHLVKHNLLEQEGYLSHCALLFTVLASIYTYAF